MFVANRDLLEKSNPILWDISEEEDEQNDDVLLPANFDDNLLDTLIDTTFTSPSKKDIIPNEKLNAPIATIATIQKDIFGRKSPRNRPVWKTRPQNYGKIFNLMHGTEMESDKFPKGRMKSSTDVNYLMELYSDDSIDLFSVIDSNKTANCYKPGDYYKVPSGYVFRSTPGDQFQYLTTLDIQSYICAGLNSKIKFVWILGSDADGKITGCKMDYIERDLFRQGIDYALSSEFIPVLSSDLVKVSFLRVSHEFDSDICLIEISVNITVTTLYQLSSGRIFIDNGGCPSLLPNMNEARLLLLDRKYSAYIENSKIFDNKKIQILKLSTMQPVSKGYNSFLSVSLSLVIGAILGYTVSKRLDV